MGDEFGNAVASAGDVNGDGYPDVIVGAWTADRPTGDAGSAYVFFGGPAADGAPDWILRGQAFGDNFGTSVASAGDVNGDGYGDVIVGAWQGEYSSQGTGRAYVFFGGPNPDTIPDLVLTGEGHGDHFGVSVGSAGDLNGDGYADVIVGASENSAGGTDAGRAYVYFGGPTLDAVPDLVVTGSAYDHLGYAVSGGRDLNGDGYADFAVGAYQPFGSGRAYVFFGGPGLDGIADAVLSGEAPGDRFGVALAVVNDVNGDGYADLLLTADKNDAGGLDAGRAYLFQGGPGFDAVPDRVFTGPVAGDNFGQSIAYAGDMNGDGFGDVVVGTGFNSANGTDAGRAYVYFGGPTMDSGADMVRNGDAPGDRFGNSVAGVGDYNHDGAGDIVVGAYFNDAGATDAGRAYIVTQDIARPPVVTAPASVSGTTAVLIRFTVTVSDPNADAIASLTAAPLPIGATFTVMDDRNTSGVFQWIPGPSQTGSFPVTFTATNDLTGSATTQINVNTPNRAPTLSPVANMSVVAGSIADQTLHGSDPDGDVLSFGLASGPSFASVTTVDATTGNLHLAPGIGDAGSYAATVRVSDGRGGTATASLAITVTATNRPPVLSGPAGVFGAEGVALSFVVTATDPDGNHVTLAAINRPVGSLFVDNGNNTGSFAWTPGFGQAGSYTITFTGRDDLGASAAPLNVTITVDDVNRQPISAPGGPYTGVINVPITFNGTGSMDPDGTPLNYLWNFGDSTTGAGVTPLHAYAVGGTFTVTLTVDDGSLTDHASTIATVQDVFPARAFTTNANRIIRLGSGKATWCAEVEPVADDFLTTSVLTSTITMKYGAGQISAQGADVSIGADKDGNGIAEMTACFSKTDLRTLFAGISNGTSTVSVTLEGDLSTGGRFRGTLTVDVSKSGGALAASLSPNPLNPTATLTFVTTRPGSVRIRIFDLQGRLVRTLAASTYMAAGYHDVPVDGRNDAGQPLASGTYFYRIESAEDSATGRFVVLK